MTAKIAPQCAESLPRVPKATQRLELDIDLDDDLNLGLEINEKFFIEGFQEMGLQELKFTIGDQIICVNGRNIKTVAHYQRLLQKYSPHIRISVFRPMYTIKAHQWLYTFTHSRKFCW
uniref:PDZ domain-containing protein n=1 Tax=Panagrolaimus sp. PS1159 TaxID=55785 RepID=A0AC35FS22_9BILA